MSAGVFALYRFFAEDGSLLYVGLTVNPGARLRKHKAEKPWWSTIASITIEQHTSLEELRKAERDAIRTEKPAHNIQLNGGTKAERRAALRDNGWNRISGRPPECWTHDDHPHCHFSLAAAWAKADLQLPPTTATEQDAIDGLVGRHFHSWRDPSTDESAHARIRNGKVVEWQGHITEHVGGDLYLIELYSWWDGSPNDGERLVSIDDMFSWTFYDSALEMQIALGCSEYEDGRTCGGEVTHYIDHRHWEGGIRWLCTTCVERYPGFKDAKSLRWSNGKPVLP